MTTITLPYLIIETHEIVESVIGLAIGAGVGAVLFVWLGVAVASAIASAIMRRNAKPIPPGAEQ